MCLTCICFYVVHGTVFLFYDEVLVDMGDDGKEYLCSFEFKHYFILGVNERFVNLFFPTAANYS
jgi:hypothetical protein